MPEGEPWGETLFCKPLDGGHPACQRGAHGGGTGQATNSRRGLSAHLTGRLSSSICCSTQTQPSEKPLGWVPHKIVPPLMLTKCLSYRLQCGQVKTHQTAG